MMDLRRNTLCRAIIAKVQIAEISELTSCKTSSTVRAVWVTRGVLQNLKTVEERWPVWAIRRKNPDVSDIVPFAGQLVVHTDYVEKHRITFAEPAASKIIVLTVFQVPVHPERTCDCPTIFEVHVRLYVLETPARIKEYLPLRLAYH